MGRLFGTDGVRGRANAELTPELAMSLAVAAAHVLAGEAATRPPLVVVGRDPRASGEMLEAAIASALRSMSSSSTPRLYCSTGSSPWAGRPPR